MTMELVQSHGTVCAACFLTAAAMRMPSTTIWRTKTITMDMSRSEKGVEWLQLLFIVGEVAYLEKENAIQCGKIFPSFFSQSPYQLKSSVLTSALTTPTMTEPVLRVRQKQQRLSVPMNTGLLAVPLVPELASLPPFVAALVDILPARLQLKGEWIGDRVNCPSVPLFNA